VSSTPTQSMDLHYVQSSTNLNGNKKPGGNKRKGRGNNRKGGMNNNNNKPKDNYNNEKSNNDVGDGSKERRKVKFPCKLYTDDHLTHSCPKLVEVARLLSLPSTMLNNPFLHKQHMASSSSNVINAKNGSQNSLTQDGDHLCINMVKSEVNVATRSHNYSSSQTVLGLYSPLSLETPL
jgi:hypothetical protein